MTLSMLSELLPWSVFLPIVVWQWSKDLKQSDSDAKEQCSLPPHYGEVTNRLASFLIERDHAQKTSDDSRRMARSLKDRPEAKRD